MLLLAFEIHHLCHLKIVLIKQDIHNNKKKGKNISPLLCLFNTLDHPEFKKEKNQVEESTTPKKEQNKRNMQLQKGLQVTVHQSCSYLNISFEWLCLITLTSKGKWLLCFLNTKSNCFQTFDEGY